MYEGLGILLRPALTLQFELLTDKCLKKSERNAATIFIKKKEEDLHSLSKRTPF